MLVPHPYQTEAIEQILEDKKTLVKASLGSGKTLIAVEVMRRAETKVNLVVAPISTFSGWDKTLQRQGMEPGRVLDNKKAGKLAFLDLANGVPGTYLISYQKMLRLHWGEFDIDCLVIDEVHNAQNRKSMTYRMLRTISPEYVIALSGTPFANKPEGAFAVGKVIWKQQWGNSFYKWCSEYLLPEFSPFTKYAFGAEREPGRILADMPSVVQINREYTGEVVVHPVEVSLTAKQKRIYRELQEDAIAWLDENPLVAELPSTKYLRLMETTLAEPSVDYVFDEETMEQKAVVSFADDAKSAKMDAVEELLKDMWAEKLVPVVLYTGSRKFAQYATQRLNKKGYPAKSYVGGMSVDERDDREEGFGKDFHVLVATIQAVGTGTDWLPDKCATEMWLSLSDNSIQNQQCRGRLARQGQKRTVNRFIIRALDTVETEKQHPRLAGIEQMMRETYNVDTEQVSV